jgi:hypothetical protein
MKGGGVTMSRRLIALLIVAVAGLTACGQAAASTSKQPSSGDYRLFLEEGYSDAGQHVIVRDATTGALERVLPIGTPAPDWSRYYTVAQASGAARVTAIDPATGRTLAQTAVAAGYTLPSLGTLGPTAGLSPNGAWLTLTDNGRTASGNLVTRFLVGASSLSAPFKAVRLDGAFSFDALSNDGLSLYLIQAMADPNHYQVRLFDLGQNLLTPTPIVDKLEPKEPMQGIRGDSVASAAGDYVFTVYIRDSGPFIHALPLNFPFAFCVNLPKDAANNIEQQFGWSLAITPDGSRVYAANGSLGLVAAMTTGTAPTIVRTGQVALNPGGGLLGGLVTTADAKGSTIGGAALSKDGRTLFALAGGGIVAIDTTSLQVRTRIVQNANVESIRMSADGKWLFASSGSSSRLWQIDPATGAVHGEIKGAANPWAVLWASPK